MSETPSQSETLVKPDLQANLDYWAQSIDHIEQNISELTVAGSMSDDFYPEDMQRVWDLKDQIITDGDVDSVTKYFNLRCKNNALQAKIYGREPQTRGDEFHQLAYEMGETVLADVIAQEEETGPLHEALLSCVTEKQASSDYLASELKVLQRMYSVDHAVELLGVSGDSFSHQIRNLVAAPNGLRWMKSIDAPSDPEKSSTEQAKTDRDWMSLGLQSLGGIEAPVADEYVFSAGARYGEEKFLQVLNTFEHFGAERLQKIANFSGIHGLEAYSIDQIERMEQLTDNPDATAEELKNHDVMVVMTNRVGDHNAVMRNTAKEVEDGTGRVLFFEINNMTDIYRKMTKLSRLGVKPATILLAAHSNKGQFMVSDGRDPALKKRDIATIAGEKLVEMANKSEDSTVRDVVDKGYSINGLEGFSRLVESFMKPSRGIDDLQDDEDRKKIIFWACYAGEITEVRDIHTDGAKVTVGEQSVISQLINRLKKSGVTSKVDIYGAADGIQMHRTPSGGLRYSAAPSGLGLERDPLPAVRMRLEKGVVSKDEVDEIPLRKLAA